MSDLTKAVAAAQADYAATKAQAMEQLRTGAISLKDALAIFEKARATQEAAEAAAFWTAFRAIGKPVRT